MKYDVIVKVNARENKVEEISSDSLRVWVTALPEKGRANQAVIQALAKHFNVSLARVGIVRGVTSAKKLIEIL